MKNSRWWVGLDTPVGIKLWLTIYLKLAHTECAICLDLLMALDTGASLAMRGSPRGFGYAWPISQQS